jgi:hypothetical protein
VAGTAGPDGGDVDKPTTTLLTRRSAAKLVHEKAEQKHRQILAIAAIRKGRFRGR